MYAALKCAIFVLILAMLATTSASARTPGGSPQLEGSWEGELRTDRWPVFVTIHLAHEGGEPKAVMTVLGRDLPFVEASWDAKSFRGALGSEEGAFVLEGGFDGSRLVGEARERGTTMPFILERVPVYPPPANRIEAWEQDLDALTQRFVKVDRSFSPGERALFLERVEDVRARLTTLDDDEIRMRLAAAVALADNAHTRLYLLRNRTELRRLPIRLWWFSDGLYVVRATPEHESVLGCRVERIGQTDARHAREIVSAAYSGTPSWNDYKSVYFLTSPEALHGFGITPDADAVSMTVSGCGSERSVVVEPLPLARTQRAVEAWWDLSPRHEYPEREWVHALDAGQLTLPLYLRHPERYYWFEFLPDSGILYVQYSRSSNAEDESVKDFGERLLAALDDHPVRGLVFDLRFNTGGNLSLAEPFVKALEERTRTLQRWVITGRATFSAGITHAAQWREAGNVTFVGEPVGDVLDFWSEGGNIILPNSKLAAHFANGAHSYSPAPCPEGTPCLDRSSPPLGPDVPATASWSEYLRGVDPAMAFIESQLLTTTASGKRENAEAQQ